MNDQDHRYMRSALVLGRRGQGNTWPNPAVGCVIVLAGRIVGRGWTQPGGRPHAETMALAQAGVNAKGATAYVTLEPCAHTGRTRPCAAALIAAGIARVVAAIGDSDDRVSGRGFAMLREADVVVRTGVLANSALQDHAGFLLKTDCGRPWVTLKLANSFDGRIATASGESRWITGSEARRAVHAMRLRHDAVLVGAGTARADDPDLTVRGFGTVNQPVRVVVSQRLDLPLMGQLALSAKKVPVWVCHGREADSNLLMAWSGLGARLIECSQTAGRLDIGRVLQALGDLGLTRILCEGGGVLSAALLQHGLVDEIVGFTAGLALGAEGRPSLGSLGHDRLADATRFELIETRAIGGDVLHRWHRLVP